MAATISGDNMHQTIISFTVFVISAGALAQETEVRYLANEGVMVTHEDTKILFDPLYDNGFNTYQMVPDEVREKMFAGEFPFDGVDAIFISHFHGDHFSADDVMRLMSANVGIRLYAPAQAVAGMRELADESAQSVFDRVTGLDMEYGDTPMRIEAGALLIEAAYIPHAGWPTRRTDVQNLAFRVTLEDTSTVLHMGDADPRLVHFQADEDYWEERVVDLAIPPYWFFSSDDGLEILENRLTVINSIGIHVPAEFSNASNIPSELGGYDLFTHPGEGRRFVGTQ